MKGFLNAILGLAVFAAYVLCIIGATGYLLYDGHILFAIAELVVSGFAFKAVKDVVEKKLLL